MIISTHSLTSTAYFTKQLITSLRQAADQTMSLQLPPRASLLGLPQELQDQIVSNFEAKYYRRDARLLKLSLTCKSLRATCLPFIFRHIRLRLYPRDGRSGPSRETVLLHSLSSRANMGQHIRILEAKDLSPLDEAAEHLLEYTTRLKSLNYHYDLSYYRDRPLPYINAPRLVRALKHASLTLTDLTISYRFGYGSTPDQRSSFKPQLPHVVCSFKQLLALKSLSIPITVLMGWDFERAPDLSDLLPPNLAHLHFEADLWWLLEDWPERNPITTVVYSYVQNKRWKQSTPYLETISGNFHLYRSGTHSDVQLIALLQKRCEALKRLLERNGLRYGRNVREMLEDHDLSYCRRAEEILKEAGLQYPPPPPGTRRLVDFIY
jgi:hypothetical protein